MLIVLFGLAGMGKSFVAQLLSENFGFKYIEGDDFVSDELMDKFRRVSIVPDDLRRQLTNALVEAVKECGTSDTVLAQAFYRQSERDFFRSHLPHALFVEINAAPDVRDARLLARSSVVTPDVLKRSDRNFELDPKAVRLENSAEGKHAVLEGLNGIMSRPSA